jgi:murein L,D-transpeptidase YcbB/YkuD
MKKFIVNEEEKNRIINLHKKLISEQPLGNNRFNTASTGLGSRQLPVLPQAMRRSNMPDPSTTFRGFQEKEGEVSRSFFEENEIDKFSDNEWDTDSSSSSSSSGTGGTSGTSGGSGGFTWKDTNLTVDDLKSGKTVSVGMRGPIVKQIQELLIGKGYKEVSKSGEPDSMFGRMTKAQVEKFQTENKNEKGEQLKKDGIVGRETITALLKVPTPNTKGLETAVKSVLPTGVSPNL